MAPQTVSSSSSKKCSNRSVGGAPHRSDAIRVGSDELGERHPEHAVDLRTVRLQFDRRRDGADDGHDVAAADDRVEVLELALDVDQRRIEPDLLVRLAQRGVDRRLARIDPPAGKADLTAMGAHVHRPPGQQHLDARSLGASTTSTAEWRAPGNAGANGWLCRLTRRSSASSDGAARARRTARRDRAPRSAGRGTICCPPGRRPSARQGSSPRRRVAGAPAATRRS